MNEKKFVVVRTTKSKGCNVLRLFVSDIIGNNGFSSQIEDAMKFEEFQADTIKRAIETVETTYFLENSDRVFTVEYSVEEI